MRKIFVSDYTYRQLTEDSASPLLFREKTALVKCLDAIGADVIELSPMKNSREDAIIYKTLAKTVQNASVSVTCLPTEESIAEAYEGIRDAKDPILSIELPVSTLAMEYSFHRKAPKMAELISSLVSCAAALSKKVEFSALNAFTADRDFLVTALKTAVSAGATSVCLCDRTEFPLPEEVEKIVRAVKAEVSVHLYVKISNDTSMATALAFYAVRGGADGIKCALCGDDTLSVSKFNKVMKAKGDALGVFTTLEASHIKTDIKDFLAKLSRSEEKKEKNENRVTFDVHSTPDSVSNAASAMGYVLSEAEEKAVYMALISLCEKKGTVESRELDALIASHAMQAPAVYILESYNISSSNLSASMASIVLLKGNVKVTGLSTGNGPIDAAFHAIENALGFRYDLDDFQIQAVIEGKEALGSAIVKLRCDGRVFSGNGLSSDIVGASVAAYINAVNKIVSEEGNAD